MAGKSSVVRVAIVGDNSNLSRSLRDSQSKLSKWSRAVGKAAIAGGLLVGSAAAYAAVNFAEAAIEDQKSATLLADALRKATGATDAQIASTEDWITKQGQLLGVTDDELRPALARLAGATGDIGEAEKLASLAMDVSVGRHKDLATVTEALAKARQGNVSGLARLGVATKDADGNTRSLADITKDLTRLYGGAAATAADTAAGKYERVKVQLNEMREDIGAKLLPVIGEFGDWLLKTGIPAAEDLADAAKKKLGPAIEDLVGWFKENRGELADLGEEIIDTAIPAIEKLGGFIGDLVGWFNKLPDPVKRFGIEVGIAALVLPKLSSALTGMKLSTLISQLGTTQGKVKLLGDTARIAAGAAGMGLLIDSLHQTDDAAGTAKGALEEISGGALLGGSMGGGWGALIGGTLGALHSAFKIMFDDVEQTGVVMAEGKGPITDYASTFDTVTGAVTQATRAEILHAAATSGALTQAKLFGITGRELVNATLGQAGAIDTVNQKLAAGTTLIVSYTDAFGGSYTSAVKNQAQADALTKSLVEQGYTIDAVTEKNLDLASQKGVLDFIGEQTREWKESSKAKREEILASQDLGGALRGLPKKVVTAVEATGIVPTTKGIARVAEKYPSIDNKHLKSIIEATGVETTVRKVRKVQDALKATKDIKPDLTRFSTGTNKFMEDLVPQVKRKGENVGKAAKQGVQQGAQGTPMNKFKQDINTGLDGIKGQAHTGGSDIGTSAKTGFNSGFAGAIASWSAQVRAAVAAAIAAGKAEAKAHSPSKETEKTGKDMSDGYVVGMKKGKKDQHDAGAGMAHSALDGLRDALKDIGVKGVDAFIAALSQGSEGIANALEKLDAAVDKQLDKQLKERQKDIKKRLDGKAETKALDKLDKKWKKHAAEVKKATKDERAALVANGKAQDEIAGQLEDAKNKFTEYAKAIKDSFVAFGDITALGRLDNGKVSLTALLKQLTKRRDEAQEFQRLMTQLAGMNLNADQIAQLTAAGPEAGLATARAIAGGGQVAVDKINQLSDDIAKAGGGLGDRLADQFSVAGTNAAKALIKSLTDQQNQLDNAAKSMALALVKEVKKQLGIKSPSKVFKGIGTDTTKGLVAGLDQRYVAQGGRTTADTLITSTSGESTPGSTTETRMKGVGVSARAGLALGAVQDMTDIINSGTQLATELITAVKKALGSHSPSKEFMEIGESVTEGLVLGLDDIHVKRAGVGLAKSLTSGFGQPQLSGDAVMGRGQGFTVGVTLSAQQVSQLERGRQVQIDLDAYKQAGGRSRA